MAPPALAKSEPDRAEHDVVHPGNLSPQNLAIFHIFNDYLTLIAILKPEQG